MLSSISGQNDPWAQLAALRAAQSTSQASPSSGSAATTATPFSAGSSVNGTAGNAITGGAFPTLSSGLLSQLLSFGSMSGNGVSGTSPSTGSAGVGFPSMPPAVPSTALPDGETGSGNLISNLFASLQSMISNIGGSLAPAGSTASSTDAAGTTATGSAATAGSSAATGSSGTSGLGGGLLQGLQSIAADLVGSGRASASSPADTTASNGPIGMPVGGPMFLPWNGGTAAGDTASSASITSSTSATGSTSTTASAQGANNALMQQISRALTAYMQSVAGGSSTIGASLTGVSA